MSREMEQGDVDEFTEEEELADCSTICCGALQPAAASAEAATEVGAALPAEDTRTYCEVCLEAKQVREQRNAEFDATVQCNEEDATDYGGSLPKRQKVSQELRVEIPTAAFMCGQPVLQWWASWMKDASKTPRHYNRKNRPAWFSAEIVSYCGYGYIKYAGGTMRAHQYRVCNWDGQPETIPDPFLMKREADPSANHSAGRVLFDSGLVGPDIWKDFNTRTLGRSSTE